MYMYHGRFGGTYYEAGFRYGAKIRKCGVILNTCPTFPIDIARIEYGKACREEISRYYPEIIQKVKGLADGNGADFDFLCSFAKDLLGGKFGFMCQYDRKKNADTVWSVIYDLSEKRIYRVEGNPGRKVYKEDLRFKFMQE